MKAIGVILVTGGLLFPSACQTQTNNKNDSMLTKSMNESSNADSDLKQKILDKGDIDAYEELSTTYLDRAPGEFLVWALIMANKYGYPQAYFDVFLQLSALGSEEFSLDHLDIGTREMAVDYLTKAVDKGHHQAPAVLGQYFIEGKYVKQDIERGKNLIERSKE